MGTLTATLYSFKESEVAGIANTIEDNRWAENLKNQASYIYNRLLQVIDSPETYANMMNNKAIPGYQAYINPSHPKASKALAKMKINLPTSYNDWLTGVNAAFDSQNGYFKTNVDNAASNDRWSKNIKPVLMAVGAPELGPGPAPKLVWLLEGYDISQFLQTAWGESVSDTLTNKPIINPSYPPYVIATVNAMVVDAIRWHFAFNAAGMSTSAGSYLANMRTAIQNFIAALLNSNLQLNSFDLTYDSAASRYKITLEIADRA